MEAFLLSFLEHISVDEVIRQYVLNVESHSSDFNSWNKLAQALLDHEYYEEAIICYNKSLELNSDIKDSWYNKGLALSNLKKYEESIQSYDKAIKIDSDYMYAWYGKGYALNCLGKFREAIKAYDRVLEIDPKNVIAWYNKGLALSNLSKYDEAIQSYDRVLEIDEKNTDALNAKGLAFERLGKYDEAIQSYDRVLEIDEKNTDALNAKGLALQRISNNKEALECYNKVTEIYAFRVKSNIEKGDFLLESSRFREAIKAYDRVLEIDPKNVIAWYNKGLALSNLSKYDEAIQSYDRVLEIDEKNTDALNAKGLAFERLGKYDDALESFEKVVLKLDPNNVNAWVRKAKIKFVIEDYEDSIRCYIHARALKPEDSIILTELRQIYSNYTNEIEKAIEIDFKLNEIKPDSQSRTMLAEDFIKKGHFREGRKHALIAKSITPRNSIKRRTIIDFLIMTSYILEHNFSEGDKKVKEFLENYKTFDEDFKIEETQWNFRGLLKKIDSESATAQKGTNLLDLANLLQGKADRKAILLTLVTSYANSTISIRHKYNRLLVLTPAVIAAGIVFYFIIYPYVKGVYDPCTNVIEPTGMHEVDLKYNPVVLAKSSNEKNRNVYLGSLNGNLSFIDCKSHSVHEVEQFQWAPASEQAGSRSSYTLAINPKNDKVYVANEQDNKVFVIGGDFPVRNITVGKRPIAIVFNPDNSKVYVANQFSNIYVINSTDQVEKIIQGTNGSSGIAIDSKGTVYVANTNSNSIYVINSTDQVEKTIQVGKHPNAISIINDKVYVANGPDSDIITVLSPSQPMKNITVGLGGFPKSISIDGVHNKVYVANEVSKTISVIDSQTDKVTETLTLPFRPIDIEVFPEKNILFVAVEQLAGRAGTAGLINLLSYPRIENLSQVGEHPTDLAINTNRATNVSTLYVANSHSNTVSIIHGGANKIVNHDDPVKTIEVGLEPHAISFNQYNGKVYVANQKSNSTSVINSTDQVEKTIPVGTWPRAIAFNPNNSKIYVANQLVNSISVINSTNQVEKTIPVGTWPRAIAFNPNNSKIYVANQLDNSISVINSTDQVETTIPVILGDEKGNEPNAIAIDSLRNLIYITNFVSGDLYVIEGHNNEVIERVPFKLRAPTGVAWNEETRLLFVLNSLDHTISTFSLNPNFQSHIATMSLPPHINESNAISTMSLPPHINESNAISTMSLPPHINKSNAISTMSLPPHINKSNAISTQDDLIGSLGGNEIFGALEPKTLEVIRPFETKICLPAGQPSERSDFSFDIVLDQYHKYLYVTNEDNTISIKHVPTLMKKISTFEGNC